MTEALRAGSQLRKRYRSRTLFGSFLMEIPIARAIRCLAFAGFDFVVIDLEHSPIGIDAIAGLVSEAQLMGLPAIVRVWSHDHGLIGKALDTGANGIMIPHVQTAAEAKAAVQAARYTPRGDRGLAPLVSYQVTGLAQSVLSDDLLVIVQIEGIEAVQECGAIAAVPGVDALFVGVYDLSQSIGLPGQVDSPAVLEAASRVAGDARDTMLGIYVDDPATSAAWSDRGFRLQCLSFDGRMLLEGALATLATARRRSSGASSR